MEILILSIIILVALILFITEKVRVDIVALLIMGALIVSGILSPAEAVKGFSNSATITVLFMFILSAALLRTGALKHVGAFFATIYKKSFSLGMVVMMLLIAIISAFINNTPVVALFIPVILQTGKEAGKPSGKLLMPLSFASIFGGMCTLIGTSTNVLVDGIARQEGLEGFGMFTLTPIGGIMLVVGMIYMLFIGRKLLPYRDHTSEEDFPLRDYITEIELFENARSVNERIRNSPLVRDYGMAILQVIRDDESISVPHGDFVLKAGDILKVRCDIQKLNALKDKLDISIKPRITVSNDHFTTKDTSLVELIITSNSRFEGKTLNEVDFRRRYRAIPLAIKHREDIVHERLADTRLKAGDIVLVEIKTNRLNKLRDAEATENQPFVLITELQTSFIKWKNFAIVIGCLVGVILLSSLEILDILGSSLIASLILILTGCVPTKVLYDVIDWKVVFLLAGALSLGVAMEQTGFSSLIADFVVATVGPYGPVAILSALYILTAVLTEMMSNNASAALLAPIAISTALQMGLSPMPFLIAITLGASASFMTPIGYQTNTMIYGAGSYKFSDFTRVGAGLSILFWLLATWLIPVFYPFS